jgi:seryl-tRNA synthetase
MLDPKLLRESPDLVRAAIQKKHLEVDIDAVLTVDTAWRSRLHDVEVLRSRQKAANNDMVALKKGSPEFIAKVGEMKAVSAEVKQREAELAEIETAWRQAMLSLPNLPHSSVPEGRMPEENVVFSTHGSIDSLSPVAKAHWEIPGFDHLFDFGRGAKVTGAGFPFYVGDGARLVRALLNFFLEEAVPTAEVPLTNFFRDEILAEESLPIHRCAYTPCFRREAGSYGKDVRGLNRLHQFDKVELLKWVHPSQSYGELDRLRDDAERLLRKLELPYRVLLMCGGDLGFAQAKKYDLEVWAAGQKRWLEVSSCSNFEAFQARRAQIRYRSRETGKPELVHTLNGSGLAVPRVLAAILENNLQPDGSVRIPAALVRFFGRDHLQFPA